ncbi:MAG: 1-acyl-sn-glycerol-3-phosphate acyltransferase [Alphaproteobacteria bacterium]|nr:1-acyl-sn-glycerol-3-phosphate acyltransferase [Alphaproteobacteria bacterium]
MTVLRALLFSTAFYLWHIVLCFACLPILILPRPVMRGTVRFYLSGIALFERVFLGLRYKVIGRENLPAQGCIIAAKHQSAWETFKLHLVLPDPVFVLKRELVWIPLWGWYTLKAGMVPVDRSAGAKALRRMLAAAARFAAQGRQIIIFPQGTRLAPGSYKPYKPGVAALYDNLNLPVVPVALNSGMFWPKGAFLKNPGTVTLEILPAIPPGLKRVEMMRQLEAALEQATDRLVAQVGGPSSHK